MQTLCNTLDNSASVEMVKNRGKSDMKRKSNPSAGKGEKCACKSHNFDAFLPPPPLIDERELIDPVCIHCLPQAPLRVVLLLDLVTTTRATQASPLLPVPIFGSLMWASTSLAPTR